MKRNDDINPEKPKYHINTYILSFIPDLTPASLTLLFGMLFGGGV